MTRAYHISHVLRPLLLDNIIDGNVDPELLNATIRMRDQVQLFLDQILARLEIDADARIAIIRNKPDQELEALETADDLHPLVHVFASSRRTYWESCILNFMNKELTQDKMSGSETWFEESRLVGLLKKDYPRAALNDDKNVTGRIERGLAALKTIGLLASRQVGRSVEWRGTAKLSVAIPASEYQAFNDMAHQIIAGASGTEVAEGAGDATDGDANAPEDHAQIFNPRPLNPAVRAPSHAPDFDDPLFAMGGVATGLDH